MKSSAQTESRESKSNGETDFSSTHRSTTHGFPRLSAFKKSCTLHSLNPLAAEIEDEGLSATKSVKDKRPFGLETIQSQLELTIEDIPTPVHLEPTDTEFGVNGDDWDEEVEAPPGAYRVSSGRQDRRVRGYRDSLRWSTRGSMRQSRQSNRASNRSSRSSISSWMSSFTQSFASSPGEPVDIWRRLSAVTIPRTKANLVENDEDVPHAEACATAETTPTIEDSSNSVKCRRWTLLSVVIVLSALGAGTGIGIILSRATHSDSQETGDENATGSDLDAREYPNLNDDIVRESFHAVMWGQVTNCVEMSLGDLQLHCPNGLVRVIDNLDSQCKRIVDDPSRLTCSLIRQREMGREGIVLFACGGTSEMPDDLPSLASLAASNATRCDVAVATDGFTDIIGGHGGSFMSLHRFCVDDESTNGALTVIQSDDCISGDSVAPAYVLDGFGDGEPAIQHYCFDANACTAPVDCSHDDCFCSMEFSMLEATDTSDTSTSCIFDAPSQDVASGRDDDDAKEQFWRPMNSVRAHRLPFLREFIN